MLTFHCTLKFYAYLRERDASVWADGRTMAEQKRVGVDTTFVLAMTVV